VKKIAVVLGFFLAALTALAQQATVIYGNDDRKDYYQVDAAEQKLADATAIQVLPEELITDGNLYRLNTVPFGTALALCPSEPFYSQPTIGHCSAFLIAPDIMVTAGHCISTDSSCESARFVFGFKMISDKIPTILEVPSSEVYSCAKVIHTITTDDDDFAVVRLDRPVTEHSPLLYRSSGSPQLGESLMVMGYPEGLPVKIAGGAHVRAMNPKFLTANLDTYGGNSGSAVFSVDSGLVEGILVRGDNDFNTQNGCYVSNRCPDNGCRGEDVTLISRVLPYLKQ
jgi:hypothetical protein